MSVIDISELNLDLIPPNMANMTNPTQGGSKIVVIGKPGTGKCLDPNTFVMLHNTKQQKRISELTLEDHLVDEYERPLKILSFCCGEDVMFRISHYHDRTLMDEYIVNSEHILSLWNIEKECIEDLRIDPFLDTTMYQGIRKRNGVMTFFKLKIQEIGNGPYMGFQLYNSDQPATLYTGCRFLLGNGILTHNTTLITSLLYEKRSIFPTAVVMSGTEDSNGHYRRMVPSTFVYNKLEEDKIQDFITRQKIAKKHLENPWAILLLDDCTDDPKLFTKQLFHNIFKNGRHWKMLFILSLQYCMDIKPVIRTNIDGTFILRETNLRNRKALWENYAGVIPDFSLFCQIMDVITDDYTALYIHNTVQSNKLEDCVFWYKAKPVAPNFRFGSVDVWKFHKQRYDIQYRDPFI